MTTTDNFALQLAVGVKDMFGDKVDEIESKSKELLETSKALQKGIGDITAFKTAEHATGRLSKHKADLTEQLENQQSQLAELYKEQAKLNNVEKEAGELSQEQKQHLAKLNNEVKAAERIQSQLQMELANTGQELKDQARNTKRLSNALEAAGVDTRKFDKSLEQLEAELKDVNKELEQTEQLAEGLSFGEQLSGGVLGAGLTAALGAGAVAAYEWDKGLKQLKTTTQLTEEQVQQLKEPLKGLQAKLGIDTTELIGAAAKINQQTGLIDSELASAVQSALTLQRVNSGLGIEIDASEIIRAQTQMRTAWNVSFATSGDLISTIYQQAGDRADDLLDTFHEYSPLLAEMGLSAEQVSAILIKGAEAGVYNYDYLADTMKEARAQLTDAGNWEKLVGKGNKAGLIDEMLGNDSASANRIKSQLAQFRQGLNSDNKNLQSESFSKLMLELTSVYREDAQKARGLIEAVFAAKGADDLPIKTLEAMALGMQDYQSILGDYHNKTQTQLEEQLTGWDRLGIAGRKLTQAWTSGVERLGVVAEPVIDMVVHLAEGVAAFAEQHPDVAAFIVALAAGAAVVASLAAAVSVLGFAAIGMKTGMAGLLAGARWLTPVFTGLGKATLFLGRGLLLLAANPVGLALMTIAGAGYLLYQNWDSLSEMASNLWDKLTAPLSLLWDLTPIKLLWDAGQQLYDWWQEFDLTDIGVNLLGSLLDGALSMLGSVGSTIRDGIADIFSWGDEESPKQRYDLTNYSPERSNDAAMISLAAGLAVSSPVAVSTPELQPLQTTQPQAERVNLAPPETAMNMPDPVSIDIDSPEDISVTAPQVAVPDIEPIELNVPQLTAPEAQPFQVTQSQPSPVNLATPETVLNMPRPVSIDINSPEDISVTAPQVTVPSIEPLELNVPQLTAPEVQPFQVTQSQPSPVNLTPPETVLNMPGPVSIDIDSPEDISVTAPHVAAPDI
ncbi:phage tail tape measure protein, partial [Pseudoalteromonas sp. Of7M-16]|uniref:phage tail tape measure protein n=1 Tax=Pseudoalteromonas sp. Of7M-16 TaxID=2917756 RepID=UPI001EF6F920